MELDLPVWGPRIEWKEWISEWWMDGSEGRMEMEMELEWNQGRVQNKWMDSRSGPQDLGSLISCTIALIGLAAAPGTQH